MKKLKTLFVQFDNALKKDEVSAFRGAVIAKVGLDQVAFHNHISNSQFIYKYPLIQYKSIYKKPAILCIGEGVDEIHKLFEKMDLKLDLNGKELVLAIDKLDLNSITLQAWDKLFPYYINNWLALNEDNYKKYKLLSGLVDKVQMLEQLLKANILSFAKGIDWTIDKTIQVKIQDVIAEKIIRYKGIPLIAFDILYECNVYLPNHLGLGKGVSHGFGMIKMKREKNLDK